MKKRELEITGKSGCCSGSSGGRYLEAAPYAVFLFSLAVTVIFWYLYDSTLKSRALHVYSEKTDDISSAIIRRLHGNEQILRGGVGMFNAGSGVSREEWRSYVAALNLGVSYPGIQGVGFSRWILPADRDEHIRMVRREGFPEYTIRPDGERPAYTSIIYLEPFDWRNQRAFGFDMFSEPVRRSAMAKAMESGETAVAARVTLVQETDRDMQSGMLMYLPVYRRGLPVDTAANRKRAILGFVYSPIRVSDFVHATLGRMPQDIAFEFYAADAPRTENLLFSSLAAQKAVLPENYRPVFTSLKKFDACGRTWMISFKALPAFAAELNHGASYAVLGGGILISLLLTLVVFMLNTARAREIAAARTIAESEEKYRLLVDNLSAGIVVHSHDTAVLFSNPMATDLLGLTKEQMLGRDVMDPAWCFLQDDGARLPLEQYPVNRVLSSGEPIADQVLGIQRPDRARPVWVQCNAYPVFDEVRRILQVVVAFADISVLKEYEKHLHQKNDELERFTYTVSHDLKSPLITIQSYAGMVRKDMESGRLERAAEDVRRIEGAAARMNELLRDLLELSRIGRQMNDPSRIDMNRLVADTLAQLAGPVLHEGIEVAVQPDLPVVSGDRKRIAEVLQNLIENAVKYRGGQQALRIEIGARQDGNRTVFFVRDNGAGIDPRYHENIFGLFSKLNAGSDGSGVGLALVKRIIETHGGRVWVESAGVGTGSCFCFTIPTSG